MLLCERCKFRFNYPSRSNKYCSIECAISSDDVREVMRIIPMDNTNSYLVARCVSVEMIRLLCKGMSEVHLTYTLRHAVQGSFSLPNAKALIDELYSINYGTDLTDIIPNVVKAEISQYIINNCPNFDVNKASDYLSAVFKTKSSKTDINIIFRTTLYLLYAGANIDIFPYNFIDTMIETGYAQILAFVPNVKLYPSAAPHLAKQELIKQELRRIIPVDTENIVIAYIGYDTPIPYKTYS